MFPIVFFLTKTTVKDLDFKIIDYNTWDKKIRFFQFIKNPKMIIQFICHC